jgi:hypothetical protein
MAKKNDPNVQKLIQEERTIELKTKGQPKSQAEKVLEMQISQKLGKPYKGKR